MMIMQIAPYQEYNIMQEEKQIIMVVEEVIEVKMRTMKLLIPAEMGILLTESGVLIVIGSDITQRNSLFLTPKSLTSLMGLSWWKVI